MPQQQAKAGQAPAFIVTLERNLPLARETQALLAQAGVQAELWMGVDGYAPLQLMPGESIDKRAFLANGRRAPLPGEIGCYLSHYRLWKHALKQGHERIIVFEDDPLPLPALKQVLPAILSLGTEYEYIDLGSRLRHLHNIPDYMSYLNSSMPLPHGHRLLRAFVPTGGTEGYAISKSGMEKLLPNLMPIEWSIDSTLMALLPTTRLRKYDVFPTLLLHARGGNLIQERPGISRYLFPSRGAIQQFVWRTFRRRTWKRHHYLRWARKRALQEYQDEVLAEIRNAGKPGGTQPPAQQPASPETPKTRQNRSA